MKMLFAVAAALAAAVAAAPAVAAPAPAPTQDRVVVRETIRPNGTRVVTRQRTTTTRRSWNRPRYRWRTVCRTAYRYGERRRVCRRIRYRY